MKNVLLIGFPTLDYIGEIKKELEFLGYSVTYYDIEPWDRRFKLLKRLSAPRYAAARNAYQREIIEKVRVIKYDYVIFIQPHRFRLENLATLRAEHPEATFVLYNWDSLTTYDYRAYLGLFDRSYTFDRIDAAALGIPYLPLFATRAYQGVAPASDGPKVVYFAGRIDSINRYLVLRAFKDYCARNDIEFCCFMLMSTSVMVNLLKNGYIPLGGSLSPIKGEQLKAWIRQSSAVFDYPNHAQSGYTMRVIENICAGKKIITSNAYIECEDFYNPDQFMVFKNLDFSGVKEFLARPLMPDAGRFERFYIQTFVGRLLNG
jgi:hypothetical protein